MCTEQDPQAEACATGKQETMMHKKCWLRVGCATLGMMALAIAANPSLAQAPADDSLVFIHANVIDGITNAPTMDATVVVAKGHIERIGRGPAPAGRGSVVDLT